MSTSALRPTAIGYQTPFSKRLLYFLIAAYLLVSPLSTSGRIANEDLWKWGRVALLGMCLLLAFKWIRRWSARDSSFWLNLLAGGFFLSALWSDNLKWAVAYKSLFVASCLTGQALAFTLYDIRDIQIFTRTNLVAAWIGIFLVIFGVFTYSGELFLNGRLFVQGVNPNLLAQSAAIFAILGFLHLVVETRRSWLYLQGAAITVCVVLVVLCGSRGAFLMLAAGFFLFVLSRPRRKRATVYFTMALVGLFAVPLFLIAGDDSGRYSDGAALNASSSAQQTGRRLAVDAFQDTRFEVWGDALNLWKESPAFGIGWHQRDSHWLAVQSAYLQVLVEAGIFGAVLLLLFFASVRKKIFASMKRKRLANDFSILYIGIILALLAHAAVESSAFFGSSPNSVLLSFSVAQLDLASRARLARYSSLSESHDFGHTAAARVVSRPAQRSPGVG